MSEIKNNYYFLLLLLLLTNPDNNITVQKCNINMCIFIYQSIIGDI